VQANVFNDATGADVFAPEFELGFDENQEIRTGFRTGGSGSKYFANRDKGYVGDDEVDLLGNVFCGKFARVAFDRDNARILLKLPGELGDVHIDGIDTCRAELQQAIREAASGRANVETNESRWIYSKFFKSALEFQSATACIFQVAAFHHDFGIVCNWRSGLLHCGTVDPDFAREDHGLRLLLGFDKAALDEENV
jgi:hypothetical protein